MHYKSIVQIQTDLIYIFSRNTFSTLYSPINKQQVLNVSTHPTKCDYMPHQNCQWCLMYFFHGKSEISMLHTHVHKPNNSTFHLNLFRLSNNSTSHPHSDFLRIKAQVMHNVAMRRCIKNI